MSKRKLWFAEEADKEEESRKKRRREREREKEGEGGRTVRLRSCRMIPL
jgi:hypothetical protein